MSLEDEYQRELRRQDEAIAKALAQAKEEGYEPEQVVVTLGMPTGPGEPWRAFYRPKGVQ